MTEKTAEVIVLVLSSVYDYLRVCQVHEVHKLLGQIGSLIVVCNLGNAIQDGFPKLLEPLCLPTELLVPPGLLLEFVKMTLYLKDEVSKEV